MRSILTQLRTLSAALRMLLVLTVLTGIAYPLLITGVSQLPGLRYRADGSVLHSGGHIAGSSLLGQSFSNAKGVPLAQYFQPRPSAAGAGYDPTASGASNLGPDSVVDTLPNPAVKSDTGTQSLLTQVCARSAAVGELDGVDGARPYCADGVGAVLAVFWSGPGYHGHVTRVLSVNQACPTTPFLRTYRGVRVQCARYGQDYAAGQIVPIRGHAPSRSAVPGDAVTASGSGLDPDISPAYARIQEHVIARTRGVSVAKIAALVSRHTDARDLGFLGEPTVNVVRLNAALDRTYPFRN